MIDVHTPDLARLAGLADYPGFDLLSLRLDGERDIEVKGRARVGEIELSENEWARAATLRDKYWLYVVFDCATHRPRLYVVRDPFGKLLLQSRTSVRRGAGRDPAAQRNGERRIMGEPSKPKAPNGSTSPQEPSDLEKLLALMEGWRAEPDDGEDQTALVADSSTGRSRRTRSGSRCRFVRWGKRKDAHESNRQHVRGRLRRSVKTNGIFTQLEQAFRAVKGYSVQPAERASWLGSLPRLSGAIELAGLPDSTFIGLEVQIPILQWAD